jgi:hypothetical protein
MRFALLLVVALAAPSLHAQWSQSLYTEDGVEIGVDGRLFALFAMLNGLGYDEDTVHGPPPINKPLHASARVKARQNLGRPGPSLKALETALANNPLDKRAYVAAALELGAAPNFDDNGAGALAKALAVPMREWFNEEGGQPVLRIVAEEAKPTQKKLLPILDKATKEIIALVRLGDAQDQLLDDSGALGRVAVVLNHLDAHGGVQRVQRGDVTYIVAAPSLGDADEVLLQHAVVLAVARTLVAREVHKASVPGGVGGDDKEKATDLLACAFMQKVRGRDAPCVGSPIETEAATAEALTVLAPRIDAFAGDTAVLGASIDKLLAPPPPPPPPPVVEEPKRKGKGK